MLTRSGLSLDMDYATPDIIEQIEMFFSFHCLFYSTHKHTPEKPRLRLIIPLSREVTPDEYCAVARKVADEIGIELFDDTTYEPSRLMYWPSTSSDGEFVFREVEGEPLDPDEVLAKYTDWHNTAEWPVSKRQQSVVQRDIKKQADPLEKPGTVGSILPYLFGSRCHRHLYPPMCISTVPCRDVTTIFRLTPRLALFSMRTSSPTATMPRTLPVAS